MLCNLLQMNSACVILNKAHTNRTLTGADVFQTKTGDEACISPNDSSFPFFLRGQRYAAFWSPLMFAVFSKGGIFRRRCYMVLSLTNNQGSVRSESV